MRSSEDEKSPAIKIEDVENDATKIKIERPPDLPKKPVYIDLTEDSDSEPTKYKVEYLREGPAPRPTDPNNDDMVKDAPEDDEKKNTISQTPTSHTRLDGNASGNTSSTGAKDGEKPQAVRANPRGRFPRRFMQNLRSECEAEQSNAKTAGNTGASSAANDVSPLASTPTSPSELVGSKDPVTVPREIDDGPRFGRHAEKNVQKQPDAGVNLPWNPGAKRTAKKKAPIRAGRKTGGQKAKRSLVADDSTRVNKKQASKKNIEAVAKPIVDIGSLLTGDVIRDAATHGDLAALPAIQDTKRHKALSLLVASLPKGEKAEARCDKKAIDDACKEFVGPGRKASTVRTVVGTDTRFTIPGLASTLPAHQLLGAAFMRRRERGEFPPRGGICADAMGLGKTVQMLANIIEGHRHRDSGPRTTLIVTTAALVNQWGTEIEKHSDGRSLRVIYWTPKNKPKADNVVQLLQDYDVVLTTYDEVRRSFPRTEFPPELQTAEAKNRWWRDFYEANRGVLHEVEFLRVVLDEAQMIKNYKSYTSIACYKLNAVCRWAMSGTPIQNSLHELYPYFRFLGVMHCSSYKVFVTNYIGTGGSSTGTERLRQILSAFTIRRTYRDKILGHPIVVLPHAYNDIHWCQFSDLERAVYESVRLRMIQHINMLSRSRQLGSKYSHILTLLLKLRQLTGHLLMLEKTMRDLLEPEDIEKIKGLAKLENEELKRDMRAREIRGCREKLARIAMQVKKKPQVEKCIEGQAESEESLFVAAQNEGLIKDPDNIGRHHGLNFDFIRYLKTLHDRPQGHGPVELPYSGICVCCQDVAQEPLITDCYHTYCADCLQRWQMQAVCNNKATAICKECSYEFTSARRCDNSFVASDTDEADGCLSDEDTIRRGRGTTKRLDWIDQEGADILPSAKTIAIKAQILNWMAEKPDVKIIIFTQFKNMIRILAKVCSAEGWRSAPYHGGMTIVARERAIETFKTEETQILLASLKAGGIGLNLTMAQRVIVVDPWWNSSVEQQAFCRVFRIGQQQETSMMRFLVENTVDRNIWAMQKRKEIEVDSVMAEKAPSLTTTELLELFGGVEVGDDGQPYIIPDEGETLPNPLADEEDVNDEL